MRSQRRDNMRPQRVDLHGSVELYGSHMGLAFPSTSINIYPVFQCVNEKYKKMLRKLMTN
jgi:hypothetical protein